MKASRKRPKGAFRRPFGLVLCLVTAIPNSIGHQDLAALIARQPAVTERWRAHVRNSTFGTVHAASLSFPRLVGASIPDPYFTQLAAVDPRALDATGSIPLNVPLDTMVAAPVYDFPVVERRLKGDRLDVKSAPAQPEPSRQQISTPKSKDMASRPPMSPPDAGDQTALPKGNRLAPSQQGVADAEAVALYRRSGLVAGQDTTAKRVLGTGPRNPLVDAPVEMAADMALRPAGLVAGQNTLAKRVLGAGPRKPVTVATSAKQVVRHGTFVPGQKTLAKRALGLGPRPVAIDVRSAEPLSASVAAEAVPAAAPTKPLRLSGRAASHLNQIRVDMMRANDSAAEIADLDTAPTEIAAPVPATPEVDATVAPQVADVVSPGETEKAAPEPEAQVAIVSPQPQPLDVAPVETVPAVVEPAKTADRFNTEAADQLAGYTRPASQSRVFFGTHELGVGRNAWEAWNPEEAPTVLAPPHVDTEIKRAALDPLPDVDTEKGGETIAPKGEVTGEGKRPRTPAERLSLAGVSRVKHSRCLANAIYFEARGEVERGQMAVAQVILNRAFSGYYPGNVCDVVYQNAHRHLACQFTFACDNHRDVVRDQKAWDVATRVADEALDGKFWLPEVGKATHYHATYVNPWWVRTMTKHTKLGIHIFYRPKRWGDGEEIPVWGDRLDLTGSIKREASPAAPEQKGEDKRADVQAAPASARRSIFDPVEPIELPGG